MAGEGEYEGNRRLGLAEEARGGREKVQIYLKRNELSSLTYATVLWFCFVFVFCVYTFFILTINVRDYTHFADERNENC